jgi:hypothetical protein
MSAGFASSVCIDLVLVVVLVVVLVLEKAVLACTGSTNKSVFAED